MIVVTYLMDVHFTIILSIELLVDFVMCLDHVEFVVNIELHLVDEVNRVEVLRRLVLAALVRIFTCDVLQFSFLVFNRTLPVANLAVVEGDQETAVRGEGLHLHGSHSSLR